MSENKSSREEDVLRCPRCGNGSLIWDSKLSLARCPVCYSLYTQSEIEEGKLRGIPSTPAPVSEVHSGENTVAASQSSLNSIKENRIQRPEKRGRNTSLIVLLSIVVVAFCAALLWAITTSLELSETKNKLSAVSIQLETTTAELEKTKGTLSDTSNRLTSAQNDLGLTRTALTANETELKTTQNQLIAAREELGSMLHTSSVLQTELTDTRDKLTVAEGTLKGLGITLAASEKCNDVELTDNPSASDPTWAHLVTFISQDRTNENLYVLNKYDCSQFSRDVHNNAEANGIRAAEVQVWFKDAVAGHALNAFLTSDYGLVYVCCTQSDKIAHIETAKPYRAVNPTNYNITPNNIRNDFWWDHALLQYYYIASSNGGEAVISSIDIFW